MNKLSFLVVGFLCIFHVNGSASSALPVERLFEIEDVTIKRLQKQIEPYVQQEKNHDRQANLFVSMEEGLKAVVDPSQPQLDALYGHLGNYKTKIQEYNAYVRSYNQKCDSLSQDERETLRKTLLDSTILGSLTLNGDMITQLQKHTRVIVASKNIDPVWQIRKSVESWGLLYGPFVGTFSFLRNLCMPRNVYTCSAATFGFLGAFMLLKNTPKSDVNNSVVKTSALCVGGSVVAVAAMQLYDSFGATQSQDQLTVLNATLENKNLSLFGSFRSLDSTLTGIQTQHGVADANQGIRDLKNTAVMQHQQVQQQIQANIHATREVKDGQDRLASVVTDGFKSATLANSTLTSQVKNGFESVTRKQQEQLHQVDAQRREMNLLSGQVGGLQQKVSETNVRLDNVAEQLQQLKIAANELNAMLTKMGNNTRLSINSLKDLICDDSQTRAMFEDQILSKLDRAEQIQVMTLLNSQRQLYLQMQAMQHQGITVGRIEDSSACSNSAQGHMLKNGKAMSLSNSTHVFKMTKVDAKQNVKQWNVMQKSKKSSNNVLPLFVIDSSSKQKIEVSNETAQASAALLIQSAMRGKLAKIKAVKLKNKVAQAKKSKL